MVAVTRPSVGGGTDAGHPPRAPAGLARDARPAPAGYSSGISVGVARVRVCFLKNDGLANRQ